MSPIIACAVLLTGASSLRLAPTMVLQPRRDLLAGGAAAAASTLLVPEAIAKKPLCLPGTNPAKALGGPGYTIGILEHDTPSFAKWHKVLEGFGSDLLSAYPPECKVIDEFFIKTTAGKPNGQDAVLAGPGGVTDEEFEEKFRVFIGKNLLVGALLPAAAYGVGKAVMALTAGPGGG